jgi:signal transduction histidine kinase
VTPSAGLRQGDQRWFDPALAVALLIAAEAELIAARGWQRSLVGEALLLAALVVPVAWRRRAPLLVTSVVMGVTVVLAFTAVYRMNLVVPNYAVFVLPYTVAAYELRRRAVAGLAICSAAMVAGNVVSGSGAASWVFALCVCAAAWSAGRVLRARRQLAARLRRTAERLEAERADRERLAIIEERARIARGLQAVIVRSLTAMVVQSQAAQRMLEVDPLRADEAMVSIEQTGRQALTEMRSVLGALRSAEEVSELAPQPGVGQLHALVQQARARGHQIEFQVAGEPRPLLPSADIGIYRILEEALTATRDAGGDAEPIDVVLTFEESEVALAVSTRRPAPLSWPTVAMRERIAICDGELAVDLLPGSAERLCVRLPAALDGAFA